MLALGLGLELPATAVDRTWNGGGDGINWSDGVNWGGTAPGSADKAIFNNAPVGVSSTVNGAFGGAITLLRINQSTITATNLLTLARTLQISANTTGLQYNATSGAGSLSQADDFILALNGNVLELTANNTAINATFLGTYRFNAVGSSILSQNTGGNNALSLNFGTGASPSVIEVTANGFIMRTNASTSADVTQPMTVNLNSQAVMNIAGGSTLTVRLDVRSNNRDNADLLLNNAGQITIAAGSTLALERLNKSNVSTANRVSDIVFTNQFGGLVTHAGNVRMLPEHNGDSQIINEGLWAISGATAKLIDARVSVSGSVAPTFVNQANGVLLGGGTTSTLEFDSDNFTSSRLTISNSGGISPGAGTGGSGLTTVGTLNLHDINVTFGATGRLNIDVGGTSPFQFDVLTLATGLTSPTGAGTLDLSVGGDTLAVSLVNGFLPSGNFTIAVVNASSRIGVFDVLRVNGLTDGGTTYVAPNGTYSILYDDSAVYLTFQVIPEPSMATLLFVGSLICWRVRHRWQSTRRNTALRSAS
jgi:hypothetical protein